MSDSAPGSREVTRVLRLLCPAPILLRTRATGDATFEVRLPRTPANQMGLRPGHPDQRHFCEDFLTRHLGTPAKVLSVAVGRTHTTITVRTASDGGASAIAPTGPDQPTHHIAPEPEVITVTDQHPAKPATRPETNDDWFAERTRQEIGTHVTDLHGNYLGEIIDGSFATGRWTVRGPDGGTREFLGPEMIETEDPGGGVDPGAGTPATEDDLERERVQAHTAQQIAAAPPEGPVQITYAEEAERQLRDAGRCWYQTGYGLPGEEYCGHPNNPDYFATDIEGLCSYHGRLVKGSEDPEINVGDRVRDTDPNADPNWFGTVTHVDNNGYRIRWDGQDTDYPAEYGEIEPVDDGDPSGDASTRPEPDPGTAGEQSSAAPPVETVIHVVSATAINAPGGERHILAMCGEDLGAYQAACERHPVGNYITPKSEAFARVACQLCRDRMIEGWNRWYHRDVRDDIRNSEPARGQGPAPTTGSAGGETTSLGSALAYTRQMADSTAQGAINVEMSLAGLQAGQVGGQVIGHLQHAGEALGQAAAAFNAAHRALAGQVSVADAYTATPDAGAKSFLVEG